LRLGHRARRPGRRSMGGDRLRRRWSRRGGRCWAGRRRRDGRLRMGRLRRGRRCRMGHGNHHDGPGDDPRRRLGGNMRRGGLRRRSGSRGRSRRGRRGHRDRGRSPRRRRGHRDRGRRRLVVVDHRWHSQRRNPRDQLVADDGCAGCRRRARMHGLDGAGPCDRMGDGEARREQGKRRRHRQDNRPVPRARRPTLRPLLHASNRIQRTWCSRFIPWSPSLSSAASRY
jgi:hypothetical protein